MNEESDVIKKFRINAYGYIERELKRLFPDIIIEHDDGISIIVKRDRRDSFLITKYQRIYYVIKTNAPFTECRSPSIYHSTPSSVIDRIREDYKSPYTDNTALWIDEITELLREKLPNYIIKDNLTHVVLQNTGVTSTAYQITKYTWPMSTYTLDITHEEFITKTFTSDNIADLINIINNNKSEDYRAW